MRSPPTCFEYSNFSISLAAKENSFSDLWHAAWFSLFVLIWQTVFLIRKPRSRADFPGLQRLCPPIKPSQNEQIWMELMKRSSPCCWSVWVGAGTRPPRLPETAPGIPNSDQTLLALFFLSLTVTLIVIAAGFFYHSQAFTLRRVEV